MERDTIGDQLTVNDTVAVVQRGVGRVPFIELEGTKPILKALEASVWTAEMTTLVGARGTGKWRLLEYFPTWLAQQPGSFQATQIVRINLEPVWRKTIPDSKVLSPSTLLMFSLLWSEYQQLDRPPYLQHERWPEREIRLYTDREFCRLLHWVEQRVKEHATVAIVINGARHLDTKALEWLLHLRRECDEQLALILAARLESNEADDAPFTKLLTAVLGPASAQTVSGTKLEKPQEEEYRSTVLAHILHGLDATLSPELRTHHEAFTARFWTQSGGDWHRTTALAKRIAWEVADDPRSPRMITTDIAERVLGSL